VWNIVFVACQGSDKENRAKIAALVDEQQITAAQLLYSNCVQSGALIDMIWAWLIDCDELDFSLIDWHELDWLITVIVLVVGADVLVTPGRQADICGMNMAAHVALDSEAFPYTPVFPKVLCWPHCCAELISWCALVCCLEPILLWPQQVPDRRGNHGLVGEHAGFTTEGATSRCGWLGYWFGLFDYCVQTSEHDALVADMMRAVHQADKDTAAAATMERVSQFSCMLHVYSKRHGRQLLQRAFSACALLSWIGMHMLPMITFVIADIVVRIVPLPVRR
jgi:hypothetical protein